MGKILRRILVASVVLLVSLWFGREALLATAGAFLIVRDAPVPSDAIVVLAGSLPDRILEGVELFRAGYASRVFLTREPPLPGIEELRRRGIRLPEQCEENQRIAQELGVPSAAITILDRRCPSTLAEAESVVSELRRLGMRRILLVTSNAHSRRARLIFRALARGELEVRVCPSRYDPFAAGSWWKHRGFARRVVIEYGKLLHYRVVDSWAVRLGVPLTGKSVPGVHEGQAGAGDGQ